MDKPYFVKILIILFIITHIHTYNTQCHALIVHLNYSNASEDVFLQSPVFEKGNTSFESVTGELFINTNNDDCILTPLASKSLMICINS